jgi:anti-anti-sigma regulatory factor
MVEMAIVQCDGSIERSEEALKLRNVVTQVDARIVVLDLSEVRIIEHRGLAMLLFLQRWAHERDVRLKLFNPTNLVKCRLERANPTSQFDFATLNEMTALLACWDKRAGSNCLACAKFA